jgi:flagellar basal-body rod modification protein FlgD
MKYQNPMEPSDPSAFISQTAQFTLVEKMESLAKDNAEMLASQRNSTAASLVGSVVKWDVDATDESGAPGEGVVKGVRITADGPILIIDDWEVPLARITAFGAVPADDAAADPGGSTVTPPPTTTPTDPVDETAPTDPVDDTTPTDPTDPVDETAPTDPAADPPVDDTTTTTDPTTDPAATPAA